MLGRDTVQLEQMGVQWPLSVFQNSYLGLASASGQELDMFRLHENEEAVKQTL